MKAARWLWTGLVLGLLDGWGGLWLEPTLAGDFTDRLFTLAFAMAIDASLFIALVLVAVVVAQGVGRMTGRQPGPLGAALAIGGWIACVGLVAVEDLDAHARLPFAARSGMLCALIAGALAGGLVAWGYALRVRSGRRRNTGAVAWGSLALGAVGAAALFPAPPVEEATDDRPNLVLVSLDTLRADHLGLYGYRRETAPRLAELAARGTVFEDARSPSNWTLPSHASMLTGLDPAALGVMTPNDGLAGEFETLAESLRAQGYRTAAFVGNGPWSYIGGKRGFDQGFDEYHHAHYPPRWLLGFVPRMLSKAWWKYVRHNVGTARDQIDQVSKWIRFHEGRALLPVPALLRHPFGYAPPAVRCAGALRCVVRRRTE